VVQATVKVPGVDQFDADQFCPCVGISA